MRMLLVLTLLVVAGCTVCKPTPGTPAYSPYAVPSGNAVDGAGAGDGGGSSN